MKGFDLIIAIVAGFLIVSVAIPALAMLIWAVWNMCSIVFFGHDLSGFKQ